MKSGVTWSIAMRLKLVILLLLLPVHFALAEKVLLCDRDISQDESPYRWEYIRDSLPLYLYPGDTKDIYQQLLNDYERNITADDMRHTQVTEFIKLQKAIIGSQKSAILTVKRNIYSKYVLSSGSKVIFEIPCDKAEEQWLVDITYLTIAYRKIHNASLEAFREEANKTILQRDRQYQNWFDNGLPMWPQETWFNGLFLGESDAEKPARHQWVLFRPSIGIGGSANSSILDTKLDATLGLEVAGFAYYLSDDYSHYLGASVLTTFGEDAGIGYGLLLRYNAYVLGYTRRDKNVEAGIGETSEYFYIGYDLYQLMFDKKSGFEGYKRKVQKTLDRYK